MNSSMVTRKAELVSRIKRKIAGEGNSSISFSWVKDKALDLLNGDIRSDSSLPTSRYSLGMAKIGTGKIPWHYKIGIYFPAFSRITKSVVSTYIFVLVTVIYMGIVGAARGAMYALPHGIIRSAITFFIDILSIAGLIGVFIASLGLLFILMAKLENRVDTWSYTAKDARNAIKNNPEAMEVAAKKLLNQKDETSGHAAMSFIDMYIDKMKNTANVENKWLELSRLHNKGEEIVGEKTYASEDFVGKLAKELSITKNEFKTGYEGLSR